MLIIGFKSFLGVAAFPCMFPTLRNPGILIPTLQLTLSMDTSLRWKLAGRTRVKAPAITRASFEDSDQRVNHLFASSACRLIDGRRHGVMRPLIITPPFGEKEAVFEDVFCPLLFPPSSALAFLWRGNKN